VKLQKIPKIYKFSQKIPFKKIYIFWKNIYIPIFLSTRVQMKTPVLVEWEDSALPLVNLLLKKTHPNEPFI